MSESGSSQSLIDAISSIGRPRIAVVGDAILDEYVWGEVERISPEAPIPVLRVRRRENRLGGAASVVANLARLDAEVLFLSVIGEDSAGDRLARLVEAGGTNPGSLLRLTGYPTILKTRHLGYVQHADRAVQQLLRVDDEDARPLSLDTVRPLLDRLEAEMKDLDAVLVSDYNKGLLGMEFLKELIRIAASKPVLVDPARIPDFERYRGAFLACPNRYETAMATGMPCDRLELCARAGAALASARDFRHVAVTMDRDGIYLCSAGGESRHFPTRSTLVTDVTGAGDMVLSILGLVIAGRGGVDDAVRLANVAAGIEIRRLGATPIARQEIISELLNRGHMGAVKIKTLEELLPRVGELRAAGRKVVFTNGCFDLLHFGHHYLLNQARRLGDCLIVAVNNDASVRRLKGPNRPINREQERMLMISGLESVDYVISFADDTPLDLIEAIRPDVLVKGSEYRDGIVVGREKVESYGGRVELVELIPGISTTAILRGSQG